MANPEIASQNGLILAVNAGSYSLKISLFRRENIKKGPVDNINDHASAFLRLLMTEASIERSEIVHVCHRVVHGGDYFEPMIINSESYHHIEP
ncbi:hypothetical protein WOLCODRAFT_152218 [Wolfiporia cocos MD-104 SS10]|uniref:Acetate kinase n=1 Tax=Wolfiporia cocos (strain MD-104) TaxID=742152 RepID=A0A2H3JJ29_WOLCO|nr:hypothetical protein WOLCODRAFT_152218 [Wolfiporia cocos MD-104 SS10]